MRRILFATLAAMSAATIAGAAGFSIYEWSPSYIATGGTTVGKPMDASTAFINPAAMTELSGMSFLGGTTLILPHSKSRVGGLDTKLKRQSFYIPELYFAAPVTDRAWVGLAATSEFGLGTKYPRGWVGEWSNIETTIETVTLAPTAAYAITDSLSFGVGARFIYIDFYNKRFPSGLPVLLSGDGWAVGAMASLQWNITDTIDFGLTYRSEAKASVRGSAHSLIPGYTGGAGADIRLPAATTAGLNWQATEKLNLGVSLTFTEWSSFDQLFIKINGVGMPDERNWGNVWRLGLGGRYQLTDAITLMAGYIYDEDPIDIFHSDFMLPAGNRHIFSAGVACALDEHWELSFGYTFLYMATQDAWVDTPLGTVIPTKTKHSNANMFAAAIAYKF